MTEHLVCVGCGGDVWVIDLTVGELICECCKKRYYIADACEYLLREALKVDAAPANFSQEEGEVEDEREDDQS